MTLTIFLLLWLLSLAGAYSWVLNVLKPHIIDEVREKVRAEYVQVEINSITRAVTYTTYMLALDSELLQRRKAQLAEHGMTLESIAAQIADPKWCTKF